MVAVVNAGLLVELLNPVANFTPPPAIFNFDVGELVPMPTFPELSIRIPSLPPSLEIKLLFN